jgi:hypothetical protein
MTKGSQDDVGATGARHLALTRLVRSLVPPLAIALPPLFWVVDATGRASRTTLGRDQGIFQYVAWALTRGAVDYRDVRDVNGPLTHLVHLAFLALGGADEHRFRVLDFTVTGVVFAFVGACLPGLRSPSAPEWIERVAWALASWVVLSGQYLLFGFWDLAQRESFFDWFMLSSLALQLVAQAPRCAAGGPRRQAGLLAVVGALSVVPWFGKPTYALFTIAQLAAVFADDTLLLSRKRAVLALGTGGALAAATQVAFLLACGDAAAFARIQFVDVPAMYRFIWPRSAADIFSNPWCATQAIFALVGTVVLLALVLLAEMPRRTIAVALAPACALASVIMQAKGFPYHFHPVTAGVHLQWLVFAAWLAERTRVASRRWAIVRLAPVAVGVVVSLRVATAMEDSPHIRAVWLLWGASTPEDRTTPEYFRHFPEPDFFPYEMRQAAAYLRERTQPDDHVQAYGMDPYVLFLARRLSATPYIYAYDLNADAALAGGTGGVPDEGQAARIRASRDAHESDLLARLDAHPPAAFVFLDGSPLMSKADAWDDFETHCARAADWVRPRYREAKRFGHDHVWLRLDLAPSDPLRPDDELSPDAP